MSEQLLQSEELLTELRTPEELLEMTLMSIQTRIKQISAIEFDSLEEAYLVVNEFNTVALEQLNGIEGVSSIEVTLNGEGVRIPNNTFKLINSDGEEGIGMMIPNEDTFRSLEPYETESGYVECVWGGATEAEEGKFQIGLYLVVRLKEYEQRAISLPGGGVNFLEMAVLRKALVHLDGSADISITSLEEIRARHLLQTEIAKHGLAHTLFIAQLNNLSRAFYTEDPVDFKELSHVKILQRVGALGEAHARKGYGYSTTVSQAILDSIGKERKLGIGFKEKATDGIDADILKIGTVLDVLMPSSPDDPISPTLVIEAIDEEENNDPISIPFDQITIFKF